MFALIETNGATHIAIHVPKDGSERSLPAIAAMLEHNATFVRSTWSELDTVKPRMSIMLGDTYNIEKDGVELAIATSDAIVDERFVIASPELFASNTKAIKAKDAELSKLRDELRFVKNELEQAREEIEALKETP